MAEGFLGRWSRRKLDVEAGKPVPAEPPAPLPPAVEAPAPLASAAASSVPVAEPERPPPPTLDDVAQLTPTSDFSRFASAEVAPEVKNAAMKKLFSDPHFNVMDGLDVYIEDYGTPDPLPAQMLKSLASAEFLGLLEKKDPAEGEPAAGEKPAHPPDEPQSVAQSAPGANPALDTPAAATDADPDLRLQQDPAPGRQGPGHGTG